MHRLVCWFPLFGATRWSNRFLSTSTSGTGLLPGNESDRKLFLKNARKTQMGVDDDDQCRELIRSPSARLLLFHTLKPLMKEFPNDVTSSCDISWLNLADVLKDGDLRHSWSNISGSCVFLGYDCEDHPLFAAEMTLGRAQDHKTKSEMKDEREKSEQKLGGHFVNLRTVGLVTSTATFRQLKQAYSLLQWNSNNQYSTTSGKQLKQKVSGQSRICSETNEISYPQISSVAITLVTHQNYCLLARQRQFAPGMYSALAGFCAFGESAEDTVAREVAEEVNLPVTNIQYMSSQPWPFPSPSLMLGFHATLDTRISPFNHSIDFDPIELEDARWYSREDVQSAIKMSGKWPVFQSEFYVPPPFAIAHQLIKYWVDQ